MILDEKVKIHILQILKSKVTREMLKAALIVLLRKKL